MLVEASNLLCYFLFFLMPWSNEETAVLSTNLLCCLTRFPFSFSLSSFFTFVLLFVKKCVLSPPHWSTRGTPGNRKCVVRLLVLRHINRNYPPGADGGVWGSIVPRRREEAFFFFFFLHFFVSGGCLIPPRMRDNSRSVKTARTVPGCQTCPMNDPRFALKK